MNSGNGRDPWSGKSKERDPWDVSDSQKKQPRESSGADWRQPADDPGQQPSWEQPRQQASWQQSGEPTWPQPQASDEPQPRQQYNGPVYNQQRQVPLVLPMNWHKFLIYFALWAGAIANFFTGIGLFSGIVEVSPAAFVYFEGTLIAPAEIFRGAMSIVIAVLCLVARFTLAGFKRSGPKWLTAVYTANLINIVLYIIMSSFIMGAIPETYYTTSSIIMPVIMIVANRAYYKKRASMFTK